MPVETSAAAQVTKDVHSWDAGGASSAPALEAWVGARLAAHQAALAALLAVQGPRNIENTLRLYDAAIEHLALAGAQAGVLNSVGGWPALEKSTRATPSHSQEQGSDFAAIRIWHAHIDDAKSFCRDFSTRLIRDKLRLPNVTPEEVFGRSLFAQADRPDQNQDVYGKGSEVWTAMVELGKRDRSFREYLTENGIDPANPVSDDIKQRDECLRKVKPIVLLRETFWKTGKTRSRKRPALYAGEDSIYAMSDGNPRWLAGLLNDLLDLRTSVPDFDKTHSIPLTLQTPVLRAASDRMKSYIKDYPRGPISPNQNRISLFTLVEEVAKFFRMEVLGETFQGDPIGSFTVDEKTDDALLEEIQLGLLNGALIYVGSSQYEVAHELRDSRIRLSFMLMPNYRLLFRNYQPRNLSNILQRTDSRQLEFFGNSQEDLE